MHEIRECNVKKYSYLGVFLYINNINNHVNNVINVQCLLNPATAFSKLADNWGWINKDEGKSGMFVTTNFSLHFYFAYPSLSEFLRNRQTQWVLTTTYGILIKQHAYAEVLTFLVNIFCIEKVNVASNALTRPIKSKDISVAVAIITPPTTGINEQYTCRVRDKINESNQYYFTMQKNWELKCSVNDHKSTFTHLWRLWLS